MKSVSLNHRLMDDYDASEVDDMTGSIETSLLKASAVLGLVVMSVIGSTVSQVDRDQVYWAIKSAMSDINDITAVIEAFHLAAVKNQPQKNPEL